MPQLNIGDFAPQLIWLAITFIALYWAMARFALPRIGQVLEERSRRVGGDFEAAREAQARAEQESARYDSALAEARAKAQGSIRSARERLDKELGAERSEVERRIAERMATAEKEIQSSREKAMANISAIAAENAGEIVRRVTGLDVSPEEVEQALKGNGVKTVKSAS
jgi:F-type H+-transporting ATPase subunit b